MANLFGWDLLYNSVKDDIKNNQDVLVCFTHLVLISNGFKCIGLGDSKNIDGTETKTEILPKGWNDTYAIRYVYQGRLYNLRGTNVDDAIIINLIRVQERTVSMVQLNNNTVTQHSGSLDQMIPNNQELAETIKLQLIDKVARSSKYKDQTAQTETSTEQSSLPMPPPFMDRDRFMTFDDINDPLSYLPGVGRSDLEPVPMPAFPTLPNPGGGGMLFVPPRGSGIDPLRPHLGIPPGSLPPGARFDPFRPPDVDRFRRGPNRRGTGNEFPPPDFDDLYM